ncbi:hypothetical protein CAP36_15850 [Chitinophagaceae bacterium IBVUCB2]|nr:hypothetical protein CAP36_15850 [Chitinophagaceae bacterium IBVUCB2]
MIQQKQFGVWLDTQHATVVTKENTEDGAVVIVAHTKGDDTTQHSGLKNENKLDKKTVLAKYFKEIATHFPNATFLHVTGTGQVQEQFIHYLADTPQFKNLKTEESTSTKMNDEQLITFFSEKLA